METDLWHAGQILTVSQFALISLLRIDWHNLFNFILHWIILFSLVHLKCSIKHFFLLIRDVLWRQILFIMLLSYDRMIKLKGLDEKWNWNVILKLMSWKALFLHHFVTSLTTPDVTFKMTRTFLRLWFLSTSYQYLSVGMEIYDVMWCYYKYESVKIPASSIDPIIIFLQVQSHKTSPNSWRKHSFYRLIPFVKH